MEIMAGRARSWRRTRLPMELVPVVMVTFMMDA